MPTTYADRAFYRTITDEAFLLTDPVTAEIVFLFPLPMVALNVRGRYVASYSIHGVDVAYPTKAWERTNAEYQTQFAQHQVKLPATLVRPDHRALVRATRTTALRYEREHPGELVHVDVNKLGRIPDSGGWRALGTAEG